MKPHIHVGPLILGSYSICMTIALLVSAHALNLNLKRHKIQHVVSASVLASVLGFCGLIGARSYYLLFEARAGLSVTEWLSGNGLTWLGGFIAGLGIVVVWTIRCRIPPLVFLDILSVPTALAYGIGRIGCLMAGDGDYGIPTRLPWGMRFPNGTIPTLEAVHPTPIYEFVASVVIAIWLWRRGRSSTAGVCTTEYLILSGLSRFVVEFIRRNPAVLAGLTNAQVVSVAEVISGIALAVWIRNKRQTIRVASNVSGF
ncbi:MAG: prolipoprotein diacylglyceryl transferase [Acidobacteriia bacterium]|nr:prolipoprotein diacylglyceryl transferase [Terriglobia bacterium]